MQDGGESCSERGRAPPTDADPTPASFLCVRVPLFLHSWVLVSLPPVADGDRLLLLLLLLLHSDTKGEGKEEKHASEFWRGKSASVGLLLLLYRRPQPSA